MHVARPDYGTSKQNFIIDGSGKINCNISVLNNKSIFMIIQLLKIDLICLINYTFEYVPISQYMIRGLCNQKFSQIFIWSI